MTELHPHIARLLSALKEISPRVITNEPMSKHTTFRIGGPADLVVYPQSKTQLLQILALHHDICPEYPLCILGRGSNVLFDDDGYRGLVVITTDMQSVNITQATPDTYTLTVDCGVSLPTLAQTCLNHTPPLAGLAFAGGIPGSVGGAVVMNAGAFGGEISDVVVSVDCYDITTQSIRTLSKDDLDFAYRHSVFEECPHLILLSATLNLSVGEYELILAEMKKNNGTRRAKQPVNAHCAGSVFKRPAVKDMSVGMMVDDLGLKGYSIGGAQISTIHAGFIVNNGGATFKDVCALIEYTRNAVYEAYGILLECEIRFVR